jgi:hypothetical protein
MLGKRAEVIETCSGVGESFQAWKNDQLLRRQPNAWQFKNFLNAIGPQRTRCRIATPFSAGKKC